MKILDKFRDIRVVAMKKGRKFVYEVQKRNGSYYYSHGPVFESEDAVYKYAVKVLEQDVNPKKKERA